MEYSVVKRTNDCNSATTSKSDWSRIKFQKRILEKCLKEYLDFQFS